MKPKFEISEEAIFAFPHDTPERDFIVDVKFVVDEEFSDGLVFTGYIYQRRERSDPDSWTIEPDVRKIPPMSTWEDCEWQPNKETA